MKANAHSIRNLRRTELLIPLGALQVESHCLINSITAACLKVEFSCSQIIYCIRPLIATILYALGEISVFVYRAENIIPFYK